jgi:hypothetical protein
MRAIRGLARIGRSKMANGRYDSCPIWPISRRSRIRFTNSTSAYRIDERHSVHHEFRHKAVVLALNAVKPLAKDQITHDIVIQVRRPIAHVLRLAPVALLATRLQLSQRLAPRADVLDDKRLRGTERVVGEGVVEDPAAEGMFGLVDFTMGAERTGGGVDGAVPVGLADVGAAVGVDFFQRGDGVDGDGVGADTHDWACGLVSVICDGQRFV